MDLNLRKEEKEEEEAFQKWSSLSHFVPYSRLFTNFPNFLKCDKLDQPR